MKRYFFAAYETKSGKETCIGIWDSMIDLARALQITKEAAYSNLYRNQKGVGRHVAPFALHRFLKNQ